MVKPFKTFARSLVQKFSSSSRVPESIMTVSQDEITDIKMKIERFSQRFDTK